MGKPRCKGHKRSLPYCDGCKAAVAAAEEKEVSEALKAEVGFPKVESNVETDPPVDTNAANEEVEPDSNVAVPDATVAVPDPEPVPETDEPVEGDIDDLRGLDKDAIKEGVRAVQEGRITPAEEVFADIDETEKAMEEAGEFDEGQGLDDEPHTPGLDSAYSEVQRIVEEITEALNDGKKVTVLMGDAEERLRGEGRKEIIAAVREYFADGLDTVAFQLLEYLERKKCR